MASIDQEVLPKSQDSVAGGLIRGIALHHLVFVGFPTDLSQRRSVTHLAC